MKTNHKFKKIIFVILIGITFHFNCISQPGCPFIDAGPDVNVDSTGCATLHASFIATGATTSYNVSSIPYAPPFPFNSQVGTQPYFPSLFNRWSDFANAPFIICYFEIAQASYLIGTNGAVSFYAPYWEGPCPGYFTDTVPSAALPLMTVFRSLSCFKSYPFPEIYIQVIQALILKEHIMLIGTR